MNHEVPHRRWLPSGLFDCRNGGRIGGGFCSVDAWMDAWMDGWMDTPGTQSHGFFCGFQPFGFPWRYCTPPEISYIYLYAKKKAAILERRYMFHHFPDYHLWYLLSTSGVVAADGSEIPHYQPPGMVLKPVVNDRISTTNLNWVFSPDFWTRSMGVDWNFFLLPNMAISFKG